MILTACSQISSESSVPLLPYSEDFLEKAKGEYLEMENKDIYPASRKLIQDYRLTRDLIKAAK